MFYLADKQYNTFTVSYFNSIAYFLFREKFEVERPGGEENDERRSKNYALLYIRSAFFSQ